VPIGFEMLVLERSFAISLFETFILISSRNTPPKDLSLPSWYMILTGMDTKSVDRELSQIMQIGW